MLKIRDSLKEFRDHCSEKNTRNLPKLTEENVSDLSYTSACKHACLKTCCSRRPSRNWHATAQEILSKAIIQIVMLLQIKVKVEQNIANEKAEEEAQQDSGRQEQEENYEASEPTQQSDEGGKEDITQLSNDKDDDKDKKSTTNDPEDQQSILIPQNEEAAKLLNMQLKMKEIVGDKKTVYFQRTVVTGILRPV